MLTHNSQAPPGNTGGAFLFETNKKYVNNLQFAQYKV
jgi:hypothetical protein